LRFRYGVTLQRERFIEMLPMPRKEHYLPVILSPAEVLRFLEAAPSILYAHGCLRNGSPQTPHRLSGVC